MTKKSKTIILSLSVIVGMGFILFIIPPVTKAILQMVESVMGRTLRDPARWIEIIQHCSFIGLFVIALLNFLLFSKKGNHIFAEIKKSFGEFFSALVTKKGLLFLGTTIVAYFFIFWGIIQAGFYYDDDIWRSYEGSRSWIGYSRYVSEVLSILIHTNFVLSDIAPLTSILSILMMSLATLMLSWVADKKQFRIFSVIASAFIFISPFFGQNFAYRFDSPYMVLAVLFPILPFFCKEDKAAFVFSSVVFVILGCMCYQAGCGIYILLTIYFCLLDWLDKKDNKKVFGFAGLSAAAFICALLIFMVFFMNTLENSSGNYVSTKLSLEGILENVKKYSQFTFGYFGGLWTKIFGIIMVLFTFASLIIYSKQNKVFTFLFVSLILLFAFVFSFGPYILFERSLFAPRAFLGFNGFVSFIALLLLQTQNSTSGIRYIGKITVAALFWGCLVFMNIYGNALAEQKAYQDFRTNILISDLNKFVNSDSGCNISFKGSIGHAQGYKESLKNYPLLKKMITIVPAEGGIWNDDLFNSLNFSCEDVGLKENPNYPLLLSTYYHDIYGEENNFYVVLR